ncbi:hypothetical protein [Halalkalibacter nanhaiisediminis]|uniref:Uncharacterized protein n=1 Tax=Halalkalibacter nanhaiisediminis TaxID=688079 RepID=A0A562QJ69_9BACI|nr:hypothetical protein [Halalkalibacter nanhaiisediminis]TWI56086.1 hypothetical protein IQ10_01974 [Halalkalibacter nanhaiisediminis]
MKQEYINYANRLNTIGDVIVSSSNLIKTTEKATILSVEGITSYKNELKQAVERNDYAEESLAEVKVPFIVQNQHRKLVERFGQYIESIRVLNNSFCLNPSNEIEFSESEYIRGLVLQEDSEKEIEKLTQLIGDILLK